MLRCQTVTVIFFLTSDFFTSKQFRHMPSKKIHSFQTMLGTDKTHNMDRDENTKTLKGHHSSMLPAFYGAGGGQPKSDFCQQGDGGGGSGGCIKY